MGKSFKRRLRSLKKMFCCCIRVQNRVAPLHLDDIKKTLTRIADDPLVPVTKVNHNKTKVAPDSASNISEAQVVRGSASNIAEAQAITDALLRDCLSPTSSLPDRDFRSSRLSLNGTPGCVSAEAVAAIRDLAGINIAKIFCVSKLKTRSINYYSDHPEDTPLPYFICSVETNAVVGMAIRGSFAQDTLGPMFSNTQCTSMAYQCLAYKMLLGQPDTWNFQDIDAILRQGHLLHSHFRYVMKLSKNNDNRIAIHELPVSCEVQVLPPTWLPGNVRGGLVRKVLVVFLYGIDGMYAYPNQEIADDVSSFAPEFPVFLLQTFTTSPSQDINMILTINDFSMAIWRQRNVETIWMFDSHRRDATGLASLPWASDSGDIGSALARSFPGVGEVVEHVTELYGHSFTYNARFYNLVTVDSDRAGIMVSTQDGSLPGTSLDEEKQPP